MYTYRSAVEVTTFRTHNTEPHFFNKCNAYWTKIKFVKLYKCRGFELFSLSNNGIGTAELLEYLKLNEHF